MIDRLGIIDFRNIIRAIHETYDIDFSDYALTSFKRRLETVLHNNNLNNADELITKIKEDQKFFEIFLNDIAVDDTEMFRDPSLWKDLRDNWMPKIIKDDDFKIWFPDITSGEELYSLIIVLKEILLLDKVKIIATGISRKKMEIAQKGVFEQKQMEINIANYKRMNGLFELTKYFSTKNNKIHMDTSLLNGVTFLQHNFFKDKPPTKIKLIIYRNKMIYFNLPLQNKVLNVLHEILMPGGYLIIGVKESLNGFNNESKKFVAINEAERIYKKVIS